MEKRIKNLEKRMSKVEKALKLTPIKKSTEVICTYCKHPQNTRSELDMITCSNCRNKTKNTSVKNAK